MNKYIARAILAFMLLCTVAILCSVYGFLLTMAVIGILILIGALSVFITILVLYAFDLELDF